MKRLWHTLLIGAIGGIVIGYLMALGFSTFFNTTYLFPSNPTFVSHWSSPLAATQLSTLLWILIGEAWAFSSWLFEIETWSITKQTIAHCLCSYLGMTPLAILCGWFPLNVRWFGFYTLVYTGAYIGLWLIEMALARIKVIQLNQQLTNQRS